MKYNKVKGVLKSKRSAFVLTLFCAMAVSLFLLGAPTNVAADEVDGEAELIAAIEGATPGTPLTIEFKGDISLSLVTTLVIPAGTDITLTGNYSLIGVSGYPTITVEGTLTIDGITVTHP
ncbi:MAG: hypothetical protein FWG60_02130, partial [Methanomassiliicoccaceae archaeon]|nr:hypothetical protein [Methanomassiliicoccaceae archaeon]